MRKSIFVGAFYSSFGLIGLLAFSMVAPPANAQDTASTSVALALPSDPKELLQLAAKTNGLAGDDLKPWHLKASYTLFDWDGKQADEGIYEEFWAGPEKSKRIITSANFTQTEYTTAKGIFRTGSRDTAPDQFNRVFAQLLHPISMLTTEGGEESSVQLVRKKQGAAELICLTEILGSVKHAKAAGLTYCLDSGLPALRVSLRPPVSNQIVRNQIIRFQGHYIAKETEEHWPGDLDSKPRLSMTIHVDALEEINTVDEAEFTPPADASAPPMRIDLAENVTKGMLLYHPKPVYPPIACVARVEGIVVLKALIGPSGHVEHLSVVSGPPMIVPAALDGVRNWTFKPYLLNGEAVAVGTTVSVQVGPLIPGPCM